MVCPSIFLDPKLWKNVENRRKSSILYLESIKIPKKVQENESGFGFRCVERTCLNEPAAILTLDSESGQSILLAKNKIGMRRF